MRNTRLGIPVCSRGGRLNCRAGRQAVGESIELGRKLPLEIRGQILLSEANLVEAAGHLGRQSFQTGRSQFFSQRSFHNVGEFPLRLLSAPLQPPVGNQLRISLVERDSMSVIALSEPM